MSISGVIVRGVAPPEPEQTQQSEQTQQGSVVEPIVLGGHGRGGAGIDVGLSESGRESRHGSDGQNPYCFDDPLHRF